MNQKDQRTSTDGHHNFPSGADAGGNGINQHDSAADHKNGPSPSEAQRKSEKRFRMLADNRTDTTLADELDAMTRLHALADRLLAIRDLPTAMGEVLDAAIGLHGADRGTIQIYDPEADVLRYAACRGFDSDMLRDIPPIDRDFHSTCAVALRTGQRVVAEDLATDPRWADHAPTAAVLDYGAAISSPMKTRQEDLLGIMTVHFREPYTPTDQELRWADLYARLAAHLIERGHAEADLRESERELAAQLSASQRFHAFSARLLGGADMAEVLAEVLEMAVASVESDCASLQIFEPGDGNGQGPALRLVAHRGFHPDSAAFWERVDVSHTSVCSRVLLTSERAVIEDVELSSGVADGDLRAYRLSGIRGVQTTPLMSRTGRLFGAISTHWRRPHRASERQFASFDVLARQAADLIERAQVDEALRQANEELEQRVAERTAELAAANEKLRAEITVRDDLQRRLATAQEDERRRVARDLHDSVGQLLAGLSLRIKAIETSAPLPPSTAVSLAEAQHVADELGKQVHGLAVRLRPTVLDDLGLEAALGQLVDEWSKQASVPVDFQTTGLNGQRLPSEVETILYRVVQEALTNVAKHARANSVSVVVSRYDGSATAVVEDDGSGFDATNGSLGRLGLVGMRERVTLAGGELEVESSPGSGTTVIARVPLTNGRAGE